MQAAYDMQKAWDARSRKFYGTRYDYRRNAVGRQCFVHNTFITSSPHLSIFKTSMQCVGSQQDAVHTCLQHCCNGMHACSLSQSTVTF